ncbi:MAG: hypothetical protein M3N98_01345 [Actinomycetota bacterium]|nr:hypothetical protein [Actinomycetota bacterium]
MTAFLFSIAVSLLLTGVVVWEGRRRPPGAQITWGEAFVAGLFIFALLMMIYAVVPDRWLRYADSELKWRTDKIGIPMGPAGHFLHGTLGIGNSKNVIAPNGVKFLGRGKILISAHVIEDLIATVIYGVALVSHVLMVLWWQRRGKKVPKSEIEKTSAYGRPLVRTS